MKLKTSTAFYIEREYDLNIGDIVDFALITTRYSLMKYTRGEIKYINQSGSMFLIDNKNTCSLYSVLSIFKINGILIKEDYSNMRGWEFKII